jgi:hypothetical protein
MDGSFPFAYRTAGATNGVGAATGVPFPVSGVRTTSQIYVAITWPAAGGFPTGRDPAAFTIPSNGNLQSASIDTSALRVWICYRE